MNSPSSERMTREQDPARPGTTTPAERSSVCQRRAIRRWSCFDMPGLDRRLFVYGTLLDGERDHGLLEGGERLGACKTEPAFYLVDLGAYAALVPGGSTSVSGEVYLLDLGTLLKVDVLRQVPILFDRVRVRLIDASEAETYVMKPDQVPGRRRLCGGDWRKRFTEHVRPIDSPFARWARGRFSG
jgi:gamma-glutamylcyclotransferase (GGCT)/AIG2-like uncharacterized protein YtfP